MHTGLYEYLTTDYLQSELQLLKHGQQANKANVRPAEAADRLSFHLGEVVLKAIDNLPESEKLARGLALTSRLISALADFSKQDDVLTDVPVNPPQILRVISTLDPSGNPIKPQAPLIPLMDTALLTNSPGEPRVLHQLETEIESADAILVVMAFIRFSGLRPLLGNLRQHCEYGRPLQVLTTTYTNSTELRALVELEKCGAEVNVSYDTSSARLHAKSWYFQRHSGYSTAYIGSSNLTHSAMVSGMAWNVRASGKRNPALVDKLAAVFDTYWHSDEFEAFEKDVFL